MAQDRPGIGTCCWRTPRSLKRHRISHGLAPRSRRHNARTLAQDPGSVCPERFSVKDGRHCRC